MPGTDDLQDYFQGSKLYGDDFDPGQIQAWYEDEKEGYADLGAKNSEDYQYSYHAINRLNAFRHLPAKTFDHALGFGSAYGDEFLPIIARLKQITIIEPSDQLTRDQLQGVPLKYVKPQRSGLLPFSGQTFDFITCFGVLHHIPNVSRVMSEFFRVLKPGGVVVMREPIISMGDWRLPRSGLTKHERGIPYPLLKQMLLSAGFSIRHEQKCFFAPLNKLAGILKRPPHTVPWVLRLDLGLCAVFSRNTVYHPKNFFHKFRPTAAYFVAIKPSPRQTA